MSVAVKYAIKSTVGWYMSSHVHTYKLEEASLFGSVGEAMDSWRIRYDKGNVPCAVLLMRVEETSSEETRRTLREAEEALPGETVKYAIYGLEVDEYMEEDESFDGGKAWLFDSQRALFDYVQNLSYGLGEIEMHRIAVKPGSVKLVETILR